MEAFNGNAVCGLKNDALMETFYEIVGEQYQAMGDYAVYVFHDRYDIPAKGKDHVRQGESEEMFEYLICAICPVSGDYEPGEPECGFLFPAFMDGAKKTQLCGRISEGSGTSAYRASENAWRVVR